MSTERKKEIHNGEHFVSLYDTSEKKKKALKLALETRKFEIELYWKRAAYFWVFIGAAFVAYFQLITAKENIIPNVYLIVISIIGYFFSLGWYFVNRGSKYWQENWEDHVYWLEKEICGPLYSTVKTPNQKFFHLTNSFPFSVSRVNQLLNLIMLLFWAGAFIYSIVITFQLNFIIENNELWKSIGYIAIGVIIITSVTFVFFIYSKSSIRKDFEKNKQCGIFISI
jgi:hypothetical protein